MSGQTLRMSGTRRARTALSRAALRASLSVLCVVLLCVFGAGQAGPAPATAEGAFSAPSAPVMPTEPTEGPADPAGDPEVRVAVRAPVRAVPGVQSVQRPVFHVKHPGTEESAPYSTGASTPVVSARTLRSVVLRC